MGVCLTATNGSGERSLRESGESVREEWDAFVDGFLDAHFEANPHEAVQAGLHEHDGRLPDWSPEGLRREARRLSEARERTRSFPVDALDEDRAFEREYLLAELDARLFWREAAGWPRRNPMFYAEALDPAVYVTREYAPPEERLRAYTRYARAVPEALARVRTNLEGPLPATYARVGRTVFGGLTSFYERDVPDAFASVSDRDLRREFDRANEEAARATGETRDWFASRGDEGGEYALGEERFRRMLLETERVDIDPDRLDAAVREDLERNTERLRRACSTLDAEDDVRECIRIVKARKPEDGPVSAARRDVARLARFVREKELVTVPDGPGARVAESPSYLRWNVAHIDIPGPYEEGLPATYYIAPPDPDWSEEERQEYIPCRADLLFISCHEVWPGHYLHFLHAHGARSAIARQFASYGFVEGWAHYAEEICWEAGLGEDDPEAEIGLALNALLRDVRCLVAVGLHAGEMTVDQAESLFRDRAFQDAAGARQQAARGTFDPAFLNYTMGKLMLKKLREDWTADRGGRGAWREFHDRLLAHGGPPVPLVRRRMLGTDAGALF